MSSTSQAPGRHDQREPTLLNDASVLVTGGSGFLGRVVVQRLQGLGAHVVSPRSADHDLTVPGVAAALLAEHQPSYVIEAARATPSVQKTTLVGTVCSYPKFTPVPFQEESLWDGYPEETNAPYGIAKKAHLIHAQVNATQYGQQFAYLIPTNLYGPGDKFHPAVSHVIPALMKKCVEAKESGADKIDVWGTGRASREYLFVEDAAEAIVLATAAHSGTDPINIGNDREVTIRETVETIARLVGYEGELVWDPTKPDGQPRRRVSADRAERLLGWHAQMAFHEGLQRTLDWYMANREEAERAPHDLATQ